MSHERLQSVLWLSCWILLYCPPKNALFCGSTRNLSADEGEYVVLQSSPSPSLSYITWDFIKHLIAITGPGRPLQPGEYSHKYSGRLSSLRDGSLMIANLTAKVGQIYRADLFDRNGHFLCVQVYDLRTGERGGMSPSVDPSESCGPTQQLLYGLGGNIVFRLPSQSRVSYVQWDINNIDHIAITRPGGIMYRQNPNYRGKTSVMGDGSLKLSNLATNDQEVYRAEHFTNNWSQFCTQHYDVKVKRGTHVASTDTSSSTPSPLSDTSRNEAAAGTTSSSHRITEGLPEISRNIWTPDPHPPGPVCLHTACYSLYPAL